MKRGIYPALLVALFVFGFNPLRDKISSQKNDKSLAFAFDFDDVAFFGKEELIETLPSIGISVVMTPTIVSEINEKQLRDKNLQILWKLDDNLDWPSFARRYHDGDGVLLSGENLINRPFFPYELARLIKSHNGFVSLMEFSPVRNSQNFYRLIDGSSRIKSHVLGTREMSVFKPRLWEARLERAAKERWVRLIAIHFSPAVSMDTNVAFQRDLIERFRGLGYHVSNGIPKANGFLSLPSNHLGIRNLLVLLISILTPLYVLHLCVSNPRAPVLYRFVLVSAISMFSGVVIYSLGCVPDYVLGVASLRGVKAQLAVPLLAGFVVLLSKEDREKFLNHNLKIKDLLWVGFGLVALLFVYLSRSGNMPLISVSDGERHLRDAIEAFFVARPRFKEFLFAHPLFILGLTVSSRVDEAKSLLQNGRIFLWLGLIGQISVLNTFTHFHTPLYLSALRSFHGVWLGVCFSLPICALYSRIRRP